MTKTARAVLLLSVAPLIVLGADPPGFVIWPAAELKGYGRKLAPRMNEKKLLIPAGKEFTYFVLKVDTP